MIKIFKKKYDAGYNKGWMDGFEVGRKKALAEQKKVILTAIQKDIDECIHNPQVLAGIKRVMQIIRRIK